MNIGKGCKAKIRYKVDLILAGPGHDGMSNGIIDIVTSDHDEEYCTTRRSCRQPYSMFWN